jgi:hypothetical protein
VYDNIKFYFLFAMSVLDFSNKWLPSYLFNQNTHGCSMAATALLYLCAWLNSRNNNNASLNGLQWMSAASMFFSLVKHFWILYYHVCLVPLVNFVQLDTGVACSLWQDECMVHSKRVLVNVSPIWCFPNHHP